MNLLSSARIVLGVSGGVAAYKAAELASRLVQTGARVDVVLTAGAREFIRPLTFAAITQRPVHDDVFEAWTESSFGHITLAKDADLVVVAPASANTIAKLALGLTDDMLGAVALATGAPLVVAPAMEHGMFHHPATQAHLATLRARGATQIGPEAGRLASGATGDGRLATTEAIIGAIRAVIGRNGPLAGRRIVVSGGGTHEPLDPVRFLGNRSSGTMGYALAEAALAAGATVTLVTGPTHLVPPFGAEVAAVTTAEEMLRAIDRATETADALIMAAAVADFRPAGASEQKIKKQPGQTELTLRLVRNPDILASVNRPGLVKIGFAAETEDLVGNARTKLAAKGLAMIVANDAVATIGRDDSEATLLFPDGRCESLPLMTKASLAAVIVARIAPLLDARARDAS